jgi:hypothetical protein
MATHAEANRVNRLNCKRTVLGLEPGNRDRESYNRLTCTQALLVNIRYQESEV